MLRLALNHVVNDQTHKADDDKGDDEQAENEPGGAAAGGVGGLSDAKRVDEKVGQSFQDAHGLSICLHKESTCRGTGLWIASEARGWASNVRAGGQEARVDGCGRLLPRAVATRLECVSMPRLAQAVSKENPRWLLLP